MTGRFRPRRQDQVDAWQVDDAGDNGPVPDWLSAALEIGTVHYSGGERPFFVVQRSTGDQCANVGTWIVRSFGGGLRVFSDQSFHETYEAIL